MTETAHTHDSHGHDSHGHGSPEAGGHDTNYVKIWGILLALLCVSVAGPFLGIKAVTLVTAFGIALVKAYLVAKNFMHLNLEKRYIVYLLITMVALMGVFYAGASPDVMEHHGRNWVNVAAQQETARALAEQAAGGGEHGQEAH